METVMKFFKKRDGSWNYPKIIVIGVSAIIVVLGLLKAVVGGG